jgi:hypothetical protein
MPTQENPRRGASHKPALSLDAAIRAAVHDEVRAAVIEALDEARPAEPAPVLVDREGLAHALGCSLPTVDRLRKLDGFPEVKLGDVPRFAVGDVVAFLKSQGRAA